jgi:hypothetical protein
MRRVKELAPFSRKRGRFIYHHFGDLEILGSARFLDVVVLFHWYGSGPRHLPLLGDDLWLRMQISAVHHAVRQLRQFALLNIDD